jgi:hypothetical protein
MFVVSNAVNQHSLVEAVAVFRKSAVAPVEKTVFVVLVLARFSELRERR